MKKLIGVCLGLMLLTLPATAQMAESLKHQLHTEKELGAQIVTDKELPLLSSLLKDPGVKVICLQVGPEAMTEALGKALLDWVRSGKTVWFYDARLGPWFGFEPMYMTKDQFTNKPESGELGGKNVQGLATVALAMGNHDVITGVGQVTLFLPVLDKEQYGGIAVKADTVALLRFTGESPALSALRRDGRGAIFYKPLLWPEALSGERFQANVLEYSAGYQIPAPGGVGKVGKPPGPNAEYVVGHPAVAVNVGNPSNTTVVANNTTASTNVTATTVGSDRVETGGDVLVGRVLTESFRFETGSQSLILSKKEVQQLTLGGNIGLDSLQTWDGKVRKGILVSPSIQVEVNGEVRKVEKRNLQQIQFARPAPDQPNGH